MLKGAEEGRTLDGIRKKVEDLNNQILPEGVKLNSLLDRRDLLHFMLHTVLHNLGVGMILVIIILLLFHGNIRAAKIVAITIPLPLMFASIWLDLNKIPANLLSLGAWDFGRMVDGAIVMVENIVRYLNRRCTAPESAANGAPPGRITMIIKSPGEASREACHEVQRPAFYVIAIIITAYMPIFRLQHVEGKLFKPMAWTVAFALLGDMSLYKLAERASSWAREDSFMDFKTGFERCRRSGHRQEPELAMCFGGKPSTSRRALGHSARGKSFHDCREAHGFPSGP
jgi:cobalt-zinc-cadmium resistance protein CzcA